MLTFVGEPQGVDDAASYRYIEDGAVVIDDGKIVMVGDVQPGSVGGAHEVIDHRPHLILPGFIDTHIHYPQMQVIGSYAANLLEWLNTYTFVEEQRFADLGACHRDRLGLLRRADPLRHHHRRGLLLGPSRVGRRLLHRGRAPATCGWSPAR